ncbi:MAG: protoglobin domain-containing protein [Hoeflea sp.]|nr:protoglobin domain-containing protein [Hoeflea sp.]
MRDAAAADGLRARLDLTAFDEAGRERLRTLRPMIETEARIALSAFFERLQNTPEIASLFTSARQIDRLEELEVAHWSILSDGRFDGLYVDRSVILGEVRQRIGLDAGWSIGGHALVLERVIRRLVEESRTGLFQRFSRRDGRNLLADRLVDVVKAALIDIDMQVSHRLSEQTKLFNRQREDAIAEGHAAVEASFGAARRWRDWLKATCRCASSLKASNPTARPLTISTLRSAASKSLFRDPQHGCRTRNSCPGA